MAYIWTIVIFCWNSLIMGNLEDKLMFLKSDFYRDFFTTYTSQI